MTIWERGDGKISTMEDKEIGVYPFTVPHHTNLFYGSQAVYERWVTNSQPQWRQLWSGMLRPGSPKGIEKSVETVLESRLSCCAEQILNCAQGMGDQ